jgi:hypothetical protein
MLNDDDNARYQNAAQVLGGLARLPVSPIWKTDVTPGEVRWEQRRGARRLVVTWLRHSGRQQEWRAWSEPVGEGRSRHLGGSGGIIGGVQAIRQLEAFFEI